MKNMIISAMALAMATTASAAQANDFAGFRVEAQLLNDKVTSTQTESPTDGSEDWRDTDSDSRWGYGLGIGYDHALGEKLIAGVEANVNFASTEGYNFSGFLGDGVTGVDMELIREFDVSARLGYEVVPNVLLYGKAGYAVSRMRFDIETYEVGGNPHDTDLDLGHRTYNRGGLRLGVGAEVKISKNIFTKLEYRYTKYNKWTGFQHYDFGGGNETQFNSSYKFTRQQVGASVGVRF